MTALALAFLEPAAEAAAASSPFTWPEAFMGAIVVVVLGGLAWKFMDVL